MNVDTAYPLAALDLGSNSFHMLIARIRGDEVTVVDRMREHVRLGAGLDAHGHLTEDAQQRALDCLRRFGERLAEVPQLKVRAVGTNTLRKATNADVFLERAQAALGHPIEVISGREEARIIYLGVSHTLADDAGRRLVIDIGGGSTEAIIGQRFEARRTESLDMGCISYTGRFFGDGRLRREAFREAVTAARQELQTIEHEFLRTGWASAVGSSGTVLAIEAILRANGWSSEGITREGLRLLRDRMIEIGRISKLELPGLSPDRAPVLPGGLAILLGCFRSLKLETMSVSTGALREGLLYDTMGRASHEDVRPKTIERMQQRYEVDLEQAARVERMALDGLDEVAYAWNLHHPDLRQELVWAARLHEIGLALSYSGYHNHGAYLVLNSDMPGFSRGMQARLAGLIRAHRRRLRAAEVEELRRVGGEPVLRLALLLRLAATLNRSRSPSPMPAFKLVATGNVLELVFERGWLDEHPMTRADLLNERDDIAATGFQLRFE